MTAPVRIRNGEAGDADELAALADRAFRKAFAAANTAADIEAYVSEAFSIGRVRRELADDANVFLLACGAAGDITGYAKLRPGVADECVNGPAPIEIERLYVDPDATGRGIGAVLMRACLDEAAARGHRTAWLGVWEHNTRAIDFYGRWGFRTTGRHVFRLGSDDQTDLIMQRVVDEADGEAKTGGTS